MKCRDCEFESFCGDKVSIGAFEKCTKREFLMYQKYSADLLARAEAAEARVRDLDTSYRTALEVEKRKLKEEIEAKKAILEIYMQNAESLQETKIENGKLIKQLEDAKTRAEKAERERDAAIKELDDVAAAVDDLSDFIDEQIHPLVQYDMYFALRENADVISMWQYESEWRGKKDE